MHITELDAYNLADAVKFNDNLNPAIWSGDKMKPQVREHLLAIADDFREFLGLTDLEVKDITVSGSNAAYTYTPHSDIDLHLVVDIPQADSDEVYRELFDAKKYQYNDLHNITIGGYDVELYVEDARKQPVSQGIYSVKNNDWVKIPLKRRATIDDEAVKSKFEDVGHRIESALKEKNSEKIDRLAKKIKNFRQAGLDKSGEFGPENLAYKMLRKQGLIKKLYDARAAARDAELSLKERNKIKAPVVYGYKTEDLDTDGVMMTRPTNCSSEAAVPEAKPSDEDILKDFIDFVSKELKLNKLPEIKLRKDPQWSVVHKTFGRYIDDRNMLEVAWGQRHIMDVLRTVAHELTHRRQHEREDVPPSAGETGSPYENEANARAGILMRDYARLHPEYFEAGQAEQLHGDEVKENYADYFRTTAPVAAVKPTRGTMNIEGYRVDYNAKNKAIIISRNGKVVHQEGGTSTGQGRPITTDAIAARARRIINQLEGDAAEEVAESASGYIPTRKQARDPRYSMALTQDIKPGQVGKEANKLGLETDQQGKPALLIKGLANALREFKETGSLPKTKSRYGKQPLTQEPGGVEDDLGNQEAMGPEFPPEFPEGTTKIDVSDVYDWYKLGQDISDLDDANPEDYNQGPPQTVISFPSDEAEQAYLKQFKRLGLKYHDIDQGREHVNEDEQLDEVKMSPTALKKFAASPEAKGIMAGFEAELIFRDTQGDDDGDDYEADYDADERCYNIDQVVEFFENDDYGYGLSPRAADRLRNDLDERYFEWRDEQVMADFERESHDLVREVWLEERPMTERLHSALTDGMGLDDADADAVLELHNRRRNKEITGSEMSEEQLEMTSQYNEAKEIADSILDEEVEASLDRQDGYWDRALDNFRDNYDEDDSGFWTDTGLRWMSSVAGEYDLDWPIMSGGGGNGGSRSWEGIASNLERVTGKRVVVGSSYHSARRKPNEYVLEPDSSLSPDDREDYGLELVSPPMPLDEAIEQLNAIVDWANSDGDAYTNSSTGLHMGVSIPYKGGNVDYLKLMLFLGDQYVLQKFGRSANTYCDSAMKKLKQNVAGSKNRGDDKIASAMELMKHGLIELAQKYVQQGVGNSKYTSAHIKPGYIEFRSPGGDYLAQADRGDITDLEDTMRRFAYAMYLAGRPDLERPEYYKKLYKLISPEGNDALSLFAKYASGEIDQAQLKKDWAEKTLAKEVEPEKAGQWVLYNRSTGERVQGQEYGNYKETDAVERAKAKISPASSMTDFLKAYKMVDMSVPQVWKVFNSETGEIYDLFKADNRGKAMDQFHDKFVGRPEYPNADLALDLDAEPDDEIKPPKKLSRRAELAKKIAQPGDYVIINKHSGLPFYTFRASGNSQAVDFGITYLRDKGLDVENFSVQRASNVKQAIDNRVDSKQLQARVTPANYEFVYEPTGRVLDSVDSITGIQANAVLADVRRRYDDLPADSIIMRVREPQVRDIPITVDQDAEQNQVRMPNGVPVWELYDRETGSVLHVIADHTARESWNQALGWLRSVGAEDPSTYQERFAVRPKQLQPGERNLSESADPAYEARLKELIATLDKNLTMLAVAKDPKLKDLYYKFKNQKKQAEKKLAKLNEPISEMHDKAQEARDAMDQAARKMGYKDFASVPAGARNSIMRMAIEILNMTGKPDHHKQFG